MFMVNYTFDGMEQKDIVRLAEIELGREGKTLAKDPLRHEELAATIRERLEADSSGQKWQEKCGMDKLVQDVNHLLLSKVNSPLLYINLFLSK
jgi:hypothetical protein